MLTPEELAALPSGAMLAVLKAEQESRLAALEGGARWRDHGQQIKWLAAKIWELEQMLTSPRSRT